ncbi:MAG TPA: lysophospholipid acyltransferase family protein, partial [Gaiellaceae bacterium]|nr:lysophospholipid acyltransferase family protein [Gaiellaceae bacterium]
MSWPLVRGLFRLRATGLENVPPAGGMVLAANHWSNFDPWPLGIPLYPRRFLRFMAKSELFWFPLGAIVKAGGGFRVRRGERDAEAIDTAIQLCRAGHAVVMFPEGTRR